MDAAVIAPATDKQLRTSTAFNLSIRLVYIFSKWAEMAALSRILL